MGGGGNMSTPTTQRKDPLLRVPFSKPPFTISDIKKAIPPHCFKRSLLRSLSYLIYDLILVSVFYFIATTYIYDLPSPYHYLAWPAYWLAQGCAFAAVWVIAHECGHHAFSNYQWLDDTIGLILHTSLLVPYFSWKYSHRRHHANIASIENDEVYAPMFKTNLKWFAKYLHSPLGRIFFIVYNLLLTWPLYLAFNILGKPYDRFANHFNPYSPIFKDSERLQIYITDAALIAVVYALYRVAMIKGLTWLVCVYGVPVLVVNGFLVLVTYLQHTHPSLPHYDSTEWEWIRGALSTVDRNYGVLNKLFHNVTDTHVLHHLLATIPHYHAMEATNAIKPLLGEYYKYDDTPFYKALWRDSKECIYIDKDEGAEDKGVYWYKNKI